jgi:malonyl-CoA O-methyltransferase
MSMIDDSEAAANAASDAKRIATLFGRRRILEADDFLQREVSRRMLERLATIRVDAGRILDLGCGGGRDRDALRVRFPDAAWHGLDLALPRLRAAQQDAATSRIGRWLRRPADRALVQADFATLPFPAHRFDVLWSNLALHWHAAPHVVLPEWSRVTRVGGLVAFSAFGPDTLREVAEASRAVDDRPHVVPFTDMHDYGDMLVAAGYTTPVVDMERLTLTYSTAASFWADVRALGGDPLADRTRGLRGRKADGRLQAALDRTRDAAGRYTLTFELIFAHAWKGEPRTTRDGDAIVRLQRPR